MHDSPSVEADVSLVTGRLMSNRTSDDGDLEDSNESLAVVKRDENMKLALHHTAGNEKKTEMLSVTACNIDNAHISCK